MNSDVSFTSSSLNSAVWLQKIQEVQIAGLPMYFITHISAKPRFKWLWFLIYIIVIAFHYKYCVSNHCMDRQTQLNMSGKHGTLDRAVGPLFCFGRCIQPQERTPKNLMVMQNPEDLIHTAFQQSIIKVNAPQNVINIRYATTQQKEDFIFTGKQTRKYLSWRNVTPK